MVSGLLILRSLTRGFIQSPIMTVTMATLPDHQVRLGLLCVVCSIAWGEPLGSPSPASTSTSS